MKYMLIAVYPDREILTEIFDSVEEAQKAMHYEMCHTGYIPDSERFDEKEKEVAKWRCQYGYGEDCAYIIYKYYEREDAKYDWRIVCI